MDRMLASWPIATGDLRAVSGKLPAILDISDLRARLGDVVVADVRWYPDGRPGLDEYVQAPIPGAVFFDLGSVLGGPPSPKEGGPPLPDPNAFAAALGRIGIGDHDPVFAYDDAGGVI